MGESDEASRSVRDRMDPARADALAVVLGHPAVGPDDALIPFGHQIYFWDPHPAEALGPDGHPALGGFLPETGLPNRMWAGGDLTFHAPLRLGIAAEKTSRVLSLTQKEGRSGPLAFLRVEHLIHQRGALVVTEIQDLVYMGAEARSTPSADAPRTAEQNLTFQFDEVGLFRYSALTFNGHRIHYDQAFCAASGHPSPVVHGPLLAQMLILLATRREAPLNRFVFRAQSPAYAGEPLQACQSGPDLWITGSDGRIAMTARIA